MKLVRKTVRLEQVSIEKVESLGTDLGEFPGNYHAVAVFEKIGRTEYDVIFEVR